MADWRQPIRKALKAWVHRAAIAWVQRFAAFDARRLLETLATLGVAPGDAVMLHSAYSARSGFRGTLDDLTNAFVRSVGPQGHLLMVSLPYRDSSFAYLQRIKRFDVRRTPSMMGMVSEMFRRRPDVLRSLHPTHPVLVHGPRAEWFVEGHDQCIHPCGPGTPFDRLVQADGKVVFFNVPFATYTFFHYLEHMVSTQLPFPLYTAQAFDVPVVDRDGHPRTVRTLVFDPQTIARRRFPIFESELRRRGLIQTARVGASTLELVRVRDTIECVRDMAEQGRYFYDMSGLPPSVDEPATP